MMMFLPCLNKIRDAVYYSLNRHFSSDGEDLSDLDLRIFVIRHCAGKLPDCFANRTIYRPLNCGPGPFGEREEAELFDSKGENISAYNPYLNEMTGIWWIARHYRELGNPSYVGLNHYRRFLEWNRSVLRPDVIVSTSTLNRQPIRSFFVDGKGPAIAEIFKKAFREVFTEVEFSDFDTYLASHVFNRCNLFIMERTAFLRYAAFIGRIIQKTIEMIRDNVIPIEGPNAFQKRIYGLFLEQMTSYWIFHETRTCKGMKVVHAAVRSV